MIPVTPRIRAAARSIAVWGVTAGAVVGALGFVTDAALGLMRGGASGPWLASGLAAGALGALLGLALAPAFAALYAASYAIAASPPLRRAARLPVAIAAFAAASRLAHSHTHADEMPRHPLAFEIILLGFTGVMVILSLLWSQAAPWEPRARAARGAAAVVAIGGVLYDVTTRRAYYRDTHDLAALVATAALVVALRPAYEALAAAPGRRIAVGVGAILAGALAVVLGVEPASPGWRAGAIRHGHYVPRLAHAFRLLVDLDGDGFSPIAWGGDCDDRDPRRNPDARETTPGADMNCNGVALPVRPTDADRGLAPPAGDPDLAPGAVGRLVLVTIDCFRADALRADVTPRLTALAGRGLLLTRVYAGGSSTAVSLPLMHRGADAAPSDAERLARRGIGSTAILAFHQPSVPEMTRGFDEVETIAAGGPRWDAAATTDRAIAALGRRAAPHYLWVHYYDAHQPYPEVPDDLPRHPGDRGAYLDRLAYVDREVGRLIDAVEGADPGLARTAIVVTSDHGEGLGDHGVPTHSLSTWEPIVHVMGILVAPGVVPGTYDGLLSHRDLAATALGAFGGVASEPDVETFGRSWLRLRAARPALHRFVVSRSFRSFTLLNGAGIPQAAIVEGGLKLTKTFEDGLREMFDVRADPGERADLAPARAADAARLDHALELFRDLDGYP